MNCIDLKCHESTGKKNKIVCDKKYIAKQVEITIVEIMEIMEIMEIKEVRLQNDEKPSTSTQIVNQLSRHIHEAYYMSLHTHIL